MKPKDRLVTYVESNLPGDSAKSYRDFIGGAQRIADRLLHNHYTSSHFDAAECLIATKAVVDAVKNLTERYAPKGRPHTIRK